jgi:spermidine/putrescine transport system permease protein
MYVACLFIFVFVYLPIVVLVLFSFSSSPTNSWPIRGMTLNWYAQLASNAEIIAALKNSVVIGISSVVISMVLGTLGAYAAHRHEFPGKRWLQRVALLPMVLPGVVTGVGLVALFDFVHIPLSLWSILVGHVTFLIAVFFSSVFARLNRLGLNLELAAKDLGANDFVTFLRVVLPNLRVTLVGASLLAFALSFDEVQVTFFLTGNSSTLPVLIYALVHMGATPVVNALATLILVGSIALVGFGALLLSRDNKQSQMNDSDAEAVASVIPG